MGYIYPDYEEKVMVAVIRDSVFPISNLLEIIKVKVSSHGSNQGYLLTLRETSINGIERVFEIDFTEFNSAAETATQILNNNGFVYQSFKYTNHFREYISLSLQAHLKAGNVEYYHTNLGFTEMTDGSIRFLLGDFKFNGKQSSFQDNKFVFEAGDMEKQLKFLKSEIMPYLETRLAFVLGLASVVSSDLKDFGDIGTLVLNFSGQSSTGKTTITQFMASLWGSPKISNQGIVRTFNATTNSLVQTFTGTNGVPIIIDDSTSLGIKDLSSFIYNIAAGEDKLRLTSDIKLRDSKGSWSGLVAITSETSMLENSVKTGGTVARVLEFDNIVWTQSAEHAKVIKRNIMMAYGHIGKDFVNYYSKLKKDELQSMFLRCEDELDELFTLRDQYTGRITSKLAVIYLTAILIERHYQFSNFSAEEIKKYLVTFEDGKVPIRSIEAQALEIIKTFIIRNQHNLAYKPNKNTAMFLASRHDFMGYRSFINDSIVEVTVLSQVLSKELERHNIYQWTTILRYLEKQPFVKTYGNKSKASEKDNYLKARAITFRFAREDEDEMLRWYFMEYGLTKEDKNDLEKAHNYYEHDLLQ